MTDPSPPWAATSSPLASNDRGLDWMYDRDIESASLDEITAEAEEAWSHQRTYVADHSAFYREKLDGGPDLKAIDLGGLGDLPFTTKDQLQASQKAAPPFGTHLGAEPESVKRIYQTSGTTGQPSMIALTKADIATWLLEPPRQ